MAKLFAISGDPEHMPYSAASDLGLHCLPVTLFGVSRLKLVKLLCLISLRKHAYSNILKFSSPKTENFQIKKLIFFIFLLKT